MNTKNATAYVFIDLENPKNICVASLTASLGGYLVDKFEYTAGTSNEEILSIARKRNPPN